MTDLMNMTVLLTGAAGGIGRSMAEIFVAAGARLALADIEDTKTLLNSLYRNRIQCTLLKQRGEVAMAIVQ